MQIADTHHILVKHEVDRERERERESESESESEREIEREREQHGLSARAVELTALQTKANHTVIA